MKLQFKEQQFQKDAVLAVVNCFEGQPLKTNRFTLERSGEIIRRAKRAANGMNCSKNIYLKKSVIVTVRYRLPSNIF